MNLNKTIFSLKIYISDDEIIIKNKHKYFHYAICHIPKLMYYNHFDHRWNSAISEKLMYKNGFLQIYQMLCLLEK